MNSMFKPKLLLQQTRSGLTELEYYGWIVYCKSDKQIKTFGKTNFYPFFHRSCAKPLQAAITKDLKTKDFYSLSDEEIAICCASHTGEPLHIELIKQILHKAGLTEDDLQCPIIEPLNKEEQRKYTTYSRLHNNCSGKHTLMLAVCKQMGWDLKNYLDENHPLQQAIYEKIQNLCEEQDTMPCSLDGCNAPVWATSLESLAKAFYNLFCTNDYEYIKSAFLKHPYLIGGKDRPDTNIMELNHRLIAKAGAGGLLSIVNTETKEVIVLKIIDADMKARSIIAIETMSLMGWLNKNSIDKTLLNNSLKNTVTTETDKIVGEFVLNKQIKYWLEN